MSDSSLFQWVVLPILIFFARVTDVSLDTIRILLISRGKKNIVPFLGFVQVIIWLFAIRQVFLNLSNIACYISFAGGFAAGTWVGMIIEEKLAIGIQVIRVITRKDATQLVEFLKDQGYGVTSVDGQGVSGKVNIIYTILKRQDMPKAVDTIKRFNPKAFYTIEDIRTVSDTFSYTGRRNLISKIGNM
ncbi:MAG: DUF2179 domain-containing protein [Candidatus Omnitrophota bacterium]